LALCVSTSVLGEASAICFEGRQHTVDDLYEIVNLLHRRTIRFLHPNRVVAEICYDLYSDNWRDYRMKPTDLVNLGYALAYEMDYLVTSDKVLNAYRVPPDYALKVITPAEAIKRFQ
jgi:hypothetical protein